MSHAPAPADPLAPILDTLASVRARQGEARVAGLAPGLLAAGDTDWISATRYADGSALPGLIESAARRLSAPAHVAAALAWKQYAYWLLLPAVLGYARAGRVPVLSADNVLVRRHDGPALVRFGLAAPRLVSGPDLLGALRRDLLDGHLTPVLDGLHERVRVGRRTLLGSVASAVCYALVRGRDELPGGFARPAQDLLYALGVEDLVTLTPGGEVRRHTCCLAFALPSPKICAGCCITT